MVVSSDRRILSVYGPQFRIQGLTPMAKIAHIYGNGPSRILYNDYKHKDKGLLIGHNIPEAGINPDVIVVIDSQPIQWFKENNVYPTAKFWLSNRAKHQALSCDIVNKIKIAIVWDDVHRYNAGIYAVRECLNQNYDVHLWGFDSMFSDCLESPAMDRIIPRHRRPKHLDPDWQKHWLKVLNNRKNTVNVHMPKDATPKKHLTKSECVKIHKH